MSNTNNNMQTQTSNTLHYAIMEAGSKDRPPMLAPGNYVQWKSRIKRYIDTEPNHELIHYVGNKMHKAFPLLGESSHWQYKFPLAVVGVPTARRMKIPLPGVCT
nr:hypothetical protein [Tanacetum cinerariifolium]